ncbi:ISP domain-containing protein [Didymella exigua CBS 183.55]|uniref:ISP domain-containing protein n=1 Tax=Didymella exigua CBS 183.55 TaxID=1150837 RepID=A0A6A5RM25_9PLEO|nr:ISP domain-containing protein [Didymella exigua CBS 183.55]KAF1929475.1 ISP domain-containing protein [Didymella exigua CBS 183.55]
MGSIPHYFSTSGDKSSENALPASWYTSKEIYELERRAIFSKSWLLISHKSRLTQTGDWLRYSFASYDIVVTRDRTGAINAFHNICRHRAHPVIESEGAGNNKILACRYHGWSYGLNGKLAKAPGCQDLELDKDQNSLFRCHTKMDSNGFVWINLDAKQTPEVAFEKHLTNVEDAHYQINFDEYTFDREYKPEVLQRNWKYALAGPTPGRLGNELGAVSTHYFPNAASTVSSKLIALERVFPQGPDKTAKHVEMYRHKNCSDGDWETISDVYVHGVKAEEGAETAPLAFQTAVRDAVTEHYRQEQAAGKEIWPARPVANGIADQADEDERFCAGLACGTQSRVLAW